MNQQHCLQCFNTVGWASERASGLQKNEWWWAGIVICLERGANDFHMVQLMPMNGLTRLLWKKAVKRMSNIIMYTCILHWQRFNVHLSREPWISCFQLMFQKWTFGSTWCSLYRQDAIPVTQLPVWEHGRVVYIRHYMCCSFVVCQYVILQLSPPRRGQGEPFDGFCALLMLLRC